MFIYIISGIISIITNLALLAEAHPMLYNYLITLFFIATKSYISLSRKYCCYAVMIDFLASLYMILILVLNDVPENWFCSTLYVLTVLPYAPMVLLLSNKWNQLMLAVLLAHLLFFTISLFVCGIRKRAICSE